MIFTNLFVRDIIIVIAIRLLLLFAKGVFLMHRILTISGVYMCLRAYVGNIPMRYQEKYGEGFEFLPGGKGVVAAAAFSALGADSMLCAKMANDANGKTLAEFFSAANVSCRYESKAKTDKTGYQLTIFENDSSWRTVKFAGANMALTADDVESAFTCMPDAVYIQKEVPDKIIIEACRLAHEKDIPIFYQPCGPRGELTPAMLGELEMFIVDAEDVFSYSGVEMRDFESYLQACMALESRVRAKKYVVRIDDERGTFIYDSKFHNIIEPHTIATVDKGGAFEIFGAATVCEYLKSGNFRRSVTYGNIAYSLSASRLGDVDSIPTANEIDDHIKENGIDLG